MEHANSETEALDLEELLSYAEQTMSNASALWTAAADVDERLRLQWTLFPAGLRWKLETSDTPLNCVEFFELADQKNGLIRMVDQTGIEPVTS